ncbi:hypothetical protein, partial [uncultured Campylobacter sp.]|uniref:hypothetical protein n=1 Tax=uncultured Campylobacter sp. TaxID=218934 RepID=UPI0025EAC59E
IHKNDIQQKVFKLLKIDENEQREKFGFLLDALIFKKKEKNGFRSAFSKIQMSKIWHEKNTASGLH